MRKMKYFGIVALALCLMLAFGMTAMAAEAEYEAKIGDIGYTTLQQAIDAAGSGETVVLQKDITVSSDWSNAAKGLYNIAADDKITIDLGGNTIDVTDDSNGNFIVFYNYGDLTIKNGTVTVKSTVDRSWNAQSTVILNRGGNLTVESGSYIHNGGTSMAFSVDNSGNSFGDATFTMNGGYLYSSYIAVRQRMADPTLNGEPGNGICNMTVSGGVIKGENRGIWGQITNASTQWMGNLTVTAGTVEGGKSAIDMTADGYQNMSVSVSDEAVIVGSIKGETSDITVTGGTFTVEPTEFITDASAVKTVVARIGDTYYETMAKAIAAAPKATETTIELLADAPCSVMVGHQFVQNITIDLGGHTLSTNGIVLTSYRSGTTLTLKNGTVKGNSSSGTLRATYGGNILLGENLNVVGAGGSATLVYVDNGCVEIVTKDGVAFSGGKTDFKTSSNKNNVLKVAAGVNRVYYATLKDAIDAANDGDTVVLAGDINVTKEDVSLLDNEYESIFVISGKTVTIDLNGKNVTCNADGIAMLVGLFATEDEGHLTLTGDGNVTVNNTAENMANCLIMNYDGTSSITIDGGNYYLDYSNNALVDTRSNEGITVNGGTFKLGNLGTLKNGSPWIFNAAGQNTAHVIVTGGTFQSDVAHQYYPFEVSIAKELALKKTEDGMYTVVDAVAYVTEREWSSNWYTNEIGYATLEEAIAACEGSKSKVYYKKTYVSDPEKVVLLGDVVLEDTLTVGADDVITIDLNGNTISYKNEEAKASCAINNKGMLTLENGTVTYEGVGDTSFGYGTNTINNSGKLTVDADIVNTTTAGSSVAIDCTAGATLIVNGGNVTSRKNAIRLCPFGNAAINCEINGGNITGARAVQIQLPSSDPASAPEVNLTVNGGTFTSTDETYNLAVYSYSNGQSFENVTATFNGGTFNGTVAFGAGNHDTQETVTVNGGTFNSYLGRYTADGWVDIAA